MTDPTRRQIMQMADEVGITDHAAAVRLVRRAFEVFRPAPVPVSERLPGAEDCDAEGRCWLCLYPDDGFHVPTWKLDRPEHWDLRDEATYLPFNALPLPSGEVQS